MAERDNAKLGDVLEAMWVAWEAAGAGRCADVAPFADRRAGRKHELKIYATEFVYQAAPKVPPHGS